MATIKTPIWLRAEPTKRSHNRYDIKVSYRRWALPALIFPILWRDLDVRPSLLKPFVVCALGLWVWIEFAWALEGPPA